MSKTPFTPLPWQTDGSDIWHFGRDYDDAVDPHRFTGLTLNKGLQDTETAKTNLAYAVEAANAYPTLQAKLAEAVALLREMEWAGVVIDHDGCTEPACPVCGCEQIMGHKNQCALRAFLKEVDHA